jgi:bifunctional UDP-N-acetylglucosamine pyrophosphorylase / glucosamine-1-phosphate N-acetyltransferase
MEQGSGAQWPLPVLKLLDKGVRMPVPSSVEVGEEVDPARISSDGVIFYGGTRVHGAKTLICAGVKLGGEAPVSVTDCRLGRGVELKGGSFDASVFLEQAGMASGAQIRGGCLLEEEAGGNHAVGLKQTILFPFVRLGSLINLCDCLMAGGTSRKDHSEVGSSYIHFNYTPNQDKATASLLGDVPRGVMLNEPPIFLGGQGGLIGPVRLGFGTVIAAGTIWGGDCPEGGKLLRGDAHPVSAEPFHPGLYGDIRRRVTNNVLALANLLALRQWYLHVRNVFPGDPEMGEALYRGALETIERVAGEWLARFRALAGKMEASRELAQRLLPEETRRVIVRQQREFQDRWFEVEACFTDGREREAGLEARDAFLTRLAAVKKERGDAYLPVIQSLDPQTRSRGTAWLRGVVEVVSERALDRIPSCRG